MGIINFRKRIDNFLERLNRLSNEDYQTGLFVDDMIGVFFLIIMFILGFLFTLWMK